MLRSSSANLPPRHCEERFLRRGNPGKNIKRSIPKRFFYFALEFSAATKKINEFLGIDYLIFFPGLPRRKKRSSQ